MTGVWHLNLDLDMETIFSSFMFQILAPYLQFEGPLGHDLGLWRMLEVPDWGLAS